MTSPNTRINGQDGPYLSILDPLTRLYQITKIQSDERGYHARTDLLNSEDCTFSCSVANRDEDCFKVSMKPFAHLRISPGIFEAPPRIFVLADVEGNFDALYSLLVSHHVMDKDYHWIFGENALVILGDVMDRGSNVTQCLWLIYKLEEAAASQGGSVHFILGNHEVMNLESDLRFRHQKYTDLEKQLTRRVDVRDAHIDFMIQRNNFLMGWMMNRSTIERIGETLFVHGGISPELLAERLTIQKINCQVRHYLKGQLAAADQTSLVASNVGPLWYRGMVIDHGHYKKIDETILDEILRFYSARRLVIGHTVVDEVSTDFNNKVVRVDVQHAHNKFSPVSQGLIIDGEKIYRAYGNGAKELIAA